ncbi:unnamed protein product, partial [Iphiclides podalirius]
MGGDIDTLPMWPPVLRGRYTRVHRLSVEKLPETPLRAARPVHLDHAHQAQIARVTVTASQIFVTSAHTNGL